MIEIPHRWKPKPVYTSEKETLFDAVVEAVANGASLVGASLDGASLVGARLVGASLVGASLVGASLDGASLVGASLVGARMNWGSHWLLAELLRRDIVDDLPSDEDGHCPSELTQDHLDRFAVVGVILAMRDWCWDEFLAIPAKPEIKAWAINVFARYRLDDDDAPSEVAEAWYQTQDAKTPPTEGVATDGR